MQRLLICFVVGLGLLFGAFAAAPASAHYYYYYGYIAGGIIIATVVGGIETIGSRERQKAFSFSSEPE